MVEKEIKNRRIIIKNTENDHTIADTKIISYDSDADTLLIPAASIQDKKFYRVSAIIFAKEHLYKFHGTIRGNVSSREIEVFLSKRDTEKERRAFRYPVNLEGKIEGAYKNGKIDMFNKQVPVNAVNMSSNGILLKTETGYFRIGEIYSLLLETDAGILQMQCEIARIQNSGSWSKNYGCRIGNVQWIEKKLPEQ